MTLSHLRQRTWHQGLGRSNPYHQQYLASLLFLHTDETRFEVAHVGEGKVIPEKDPGCLSPGRQV